ncbi:MAG TPA: hypothetical protein VHD32_15270 [Candidatus Didemnitutus sp.]|nr:hypothetical protein [Candidatus Didemnitutus sp.]
MSESIVSPSQPLSNRERRKAYLALACESDRIALREACLPDGNPSRLAVRTFLGYIEPFASFFPGRIGRWLRGLTFLANIGRHLGWLRF